MRKRSKYRPKAQLPDPLTWVLAGMRPVLSAKEVMDNVRIKNHLAMRCVVEGTATRKDMDVLIEAFNITEALARVDPLLGRDWSAEIRAGQDALLAMGKRGVAKGDRFLFTGEELGAANTVMELHDAQLERCTVAQMEKAIHEVIKDKRHKKARAIVCTT
jgi:hypothetical protein